MQVCKHSKIYISNIVRKGNKMIAKGDIVQITNTKCEWYPCLLIVDEVKTWGIQGYVLVPTPSGVGSAYYRVNTEDFDKVGKAIIVD